MARYYNSGTPGDLRICDVGRQIICLIFIFSRKPVLPLYMEFPNLSKEKLVATRSWEAVQNESGEPTMRKATFKGQRNTTLRAFESDTASYSDPLWYPMCCGPHRQT